MSKVTPAHLLEIENTEYVYEQICERFDDALEMLDENSIIYGGAVRDTLAGIGLEGDLDVAVAKRRLAKIHRRFVSNLKWIPSNQKEIERLMAKYGSRGSPKVISRISQFTNYTGVNVQLVAPESEEGEEFEQALRLSREVDIICCAVVMTSSGRVFETVPGAFEDCRKRVLRINDSANTAFLGTLKDRIEKLEQRGWHSEIDIRKVIAKHNRKRKSNLKKETTEDCKSEETFTFNFSKKSVEEAAKVASRKNIIVGTNYSFETAIEIIKKFAAGYDLSFRCVRLQKADLEKIAPGISEAFEISSLPSEGYVKDLKNKLTKQVKYSDVSRAVLDSTTFNTCYTYSGPSPTSYF